MSNGTFDALLNSWNYSIRAFAITCGASKNIL
jgi:hypothetical protein